MDGGDTLEETFTVYEEHSLRGEALNPSCFSKILERSTMSNPDGGLHSVSDKLFGSNAGNRRGTRQLSKTFADFCGFARFERTVFEWLWSTMKL